MSKNSGDLHFHVNDVPHKSAIFFFGLQQMLVCISALLVTPYFVSNLLCAGAETTEVRLVEIYYNNLNWLYCFPYVTLCNSCCVF